MYVLSTSLYLKGSGVNNSQCLRFSNPSIPVGVILYIIEIIRDKATLAYESKLAELKGEYNLSVKNDFIQRVLLPWILYLRGVDYIKGEVLPFKRCTHH